ncbi:putative cell-wall hydrolase [Paenibacillus larvae subsp. larvae]|nr:putative cell-wall hydrolase [Paenibacillus larvae subsp. larvae]ETK26938.1 hypothetical protein ERIC1_1c03740 [Paenibacillus larvae subsp. larvae DSM 25719]QHZ51855.1 putative cell-wall hydrolase [Paenibacillus larvae subsp. larvae]
MGARVRKRLPGMSRYCTLQLPVTLPSNRPTSMTLQSNKERSCMKCCRRSSVRLWFALLGKDTNVGLTPEQLEIVYHDLPEGEWGGEAVRLTLTRLGDPYSQVLAGQNRYTDCSYLIQWVYRQLSIQLTRTAVEKARRCVDNGWTIRFEDLAPGDLVFWS